MESQDQGPLPMPTISPMGMGQTALNPQFGVWVLSHEKDLEALEHFLKGDIGETDQDGNVTWKTSSHGRVMNDEGVYELMRFLRGLTSKIITLSKIQDEQYYRDLLDNCLAINRFLFLNHRRFELKTVNFNLVSVEMHNFIEFTFSKARNGVMLDFVHPKHRSVEQITTLRQAPAEKKGNVLSFIGW